MGQTELVRRLQLDGVPMTRETLAKIERGVRPNPRRLKVFCPAFLQKSGRGPGAAPLAARRSARNALCAKEAQEGVKGGTLAGGSPFAGGRAARENRMKTPPERAAFSLFPAL